MADDLEIDLSNFEANQKQRFDQQGPLKDEWGVEDFNEQPDLEAPQPAWDDQRPFEDLYSPEVMWKARGLLMTNAVEKIKPLVYSVAGSQAYVVHLTEQDGLPVPWASCTCPNGEARGGRPSCYHTAAVLALELEIDLSSMIEPPKKKTPPKR